jgi:hypothetical protein
MRNFLSKSTRYFCKLDRFGAIQKVCSITKRSKLRESEQIYFQKSFIGSVREQEVAEK